MPDLIFRKASTCEANNCCLVAMEPSAAHVADSKLGDDSPVISFGAPAWRAFLDAVKHGDLRP